MPLSVADVLSVLHAHFPPALAAEWDSRGLISGDWRAPVRRVLVAVDICDAVLDEAIAAGCQMLVTHHPLWLGRHSVASAPYKLRTQLRAMAHGVALANAHTNADHANPGVSDALAAAIGLVEVRPLVPTAPGAATGTGRLGRLPAPLALGELVDRVAAAIPGARPRLAGPPGRLVERVALCGGAGDSLLPTVRELAPEVYITSDLRHHPVAEHLEAGGCPLIDINHAAAEALWLPSLAALLAAAGCEVEISRTDTANWG